MFLNEGKKLPFKLHVIHFTIIKRLHVIKGWPICFKNYIMGRKKVQSGLDLADLPYFVHHCVKGRGQSLCDERALTLTLKSVATEVTKYQIKTSFIDIP